MTIQTLRPIGGHILDIDSHELSDQVLSLARNVDMRRGFPSRIRGRRAIYGSPLSMLPLHVLNLSLNNFNWWMLFGTSDIRAVETSNSYDISMPGQLAVANAYEWSSTLLNGIPAFTNGKNLPHYWNGVSATPAAVLPGWPAATTCKYIVAFRFHLFALNIDGPSGVFENLIQWSDATEPGAIPQSWAPSASNEAGSAFLADTPGRCISGIALGTQLVIFKPTSFYTLEYAGQQPDNIFVVRPVIRSTGVLSPHALKVIGTQIAVVGNDDVVLTDGINTKSIAENRIKLALKNSIDETNSQNLFTIYDKNAKELWVCAPEAGSQFATVAHIWDQSRDNWVTRDLNAVRYGTTGLVTDTAVSQTWDSDAQVWNSDFSVWNEQQLGTKEQVVLVESQSLYLEDQPVAPTLDSIIQRLDMIFGDKDQIKIISRVHIEGSGAGLSALQFRLGSRNSTSDNIAWGAYSQRQSGGKEYEIAGKFISIEIISNTTTPVTITNISIEAEYDGAY